MLSEQTRKELQKFAAEIRIQIMHCIASLGVGHVGGSLSIADVLSVLYGKQMKYDPSNPDWDERDWLVVSKGHAGPAVYSTLALKGFIPMSELLTLNKPGTNLPSHCDRLKTKGIDMTTGSLGQGSSTAAGIALGHKMNGKPNYTYLILGDGEIEEGQVWEMAMFATSRKLDRLIAFVDSNKLQIDGTPEELSAMVDIPAKFEAFGWSVQDIDGHDVSAIDEAIENAKANAGSGKPQMIVLNTIKAKGWKDMENKAGSHSTNISPEQEAQVVADLEAEIASI